MTEKFIIVPKKRKIFYNNYSNFYNTDISYESFKEIKCSLFFHKTEDGWRITIKTDFQAPFIFWNLLRKRKIFNGRRKVQNI